MRPVGAGIARVGSMGWILFLVAISVPAFLWAYRQRLDVLKGPWIMGETPGD
jgi:hypothetical protein